jgi:hypothetical protein
MAKSDLEGNGAHRAAATLRCARYPVSPREPSIEPESGLLKYRSIINRIFGCGDRI